MNEKLGTVGAPVAALLASACCIGPALSAGLGIGAVAAAQSFAPLRPLFLGLTFLFLGLGFYFAYRIPKQATCEAGVCEAPRISRWSRPVLWIATVMVAALGMFPYYYESLRAAFDKPQPQTLAAAQTAQLSSIELKVSGMTCSGCAVSVRNALLEVPGVASASVDHEAGRATVQYDPVKASTDQLIEAVNKTGYKASL